MKDSVFHEFCDQGNCCFHTKYKKGCNDIPSLMPLLWKEEVDHVCGLTKAAVQREVSAQRNLTHAEEILSLLKTRFSEKSNPSYIFKDNSSEDLDKEMKIERFKKYKNYNSFLKI